MYFLPPDSSLRILLEGESVGGGGGGGELGGLKSESLRPRSKTDGGDGPPDTPTEKSYYAGV